MTYAAAGLENFGEHNIYEGVLNISDSLGALSPLARKCDSSISQLANVIGSYPTQFQSTSDFLIKFVLNTVGYVKPLLDRYIFVNNVIRNHGNVTAAVQTVGEIIKLHFSINPVIFNPLNPTARTDPLEYTWADPLAPSPVDPNLWNVFESLYNLMVESRFISPENLVECEGGALNMVLYNQDASRNFQAKNNKAGIYSVLDSFLFLHQTVEGCTNTAVEMGHRSALIDKEVFGNPSVIWKNIVSNLFEIFSDGLFGYAEYYYQDVISFFSAVGDFFYRTVTYRVDKP